MKTGERLSGLSSGTCEFAAGVTSFSVEPDKELVGESDADELLGLSGEAQPFVEGGEVRVVSADNLGDDEEDGADGAAAASEGPFPGSLAGVVGDRGEADELGDVVAGERADLGQLGHEAGDGAVGDAFDGAEGLIELAPQ